MNKKTKKVDVNKNKTELISLKKAVLNLKFQRSIGQLENTSEIKKTRRKIAQIKTSLSNNHGEKNA
ncbi:MAG: 50S ribosomal protein L29 [Pelagibacteraceae bacterium]|nr:50S ribosomal protein L29 [Pelagibacteraceae bacterium]|tara:strand:+ start:69237 stop:69434 length:198 start_codon:yes stop_codon:yes gene_type:complete